MACCKWSSRSRGHNAALSASVCSGTRNPCTPANQQPPARTLLLPRLHQRALLLRLSCGAVLALASLHAAAGMGHNKAAVVGRRASTPAFEPLLAMVLHMRTLHNQPALQALGGGRLSTCEQRTLPSALPQPQLHFTWPHPTSATVALTCGRNRRRRPPSNHSAVHWFQAGPTGTARTCTQSAQRWPPTTQTLGWLAAGPAFGCGRRGPGGQSIRGGESVSVRLHG